MPDDQPVMTALAEITAVSVVRGTLPAREHMVARLAALVAIDAAHRASYLMNAGTAVETGVTIEDVQGRQVAWHRSSAPASSPQPNGSPRPRAS